MLLESESARQIADFLLENQAVILRPHQPFRWSSGWFSPIYCDNRMILADPKARSFIRDSFAQGIRKHFSQAKAIAGVATAGIPHAAIVADKLNLPMAYVRPKPKEHGTQKQIEGRLESGQPAVVIEDLISTGGSSLQAIEALRREGVEVAGLLAVFSYSFPIAEEQFGNASVQYFTLTDFETLAGRAVATGYLNEADLATLREWRQKPEEWGR